MINQRQLDDVDEEKQTYFADDEIIGLHFLT